MDDEIIYSWCFKVFECFDSTPSAAIIILVEDLESFCRASNPSSNNSLDQRLRLNRFKTIHRQINLCHVPPLSDD